MLTPSYPAVLTVRSTVIRELSAIAGMLYRLNWAPKHAGNFSLRINGTLLTKISGATMKEISRNPRPHLCWICPAPAGCSFNVIPPGVIPTEEICAHILSQRIIARHRPQEKWLLHSHPPEIIRFAPNPRNHISYEILDLPRLPLTVAVVPYLPAGSKELARATARAFRRSQIVIWYAHGAIASGRTLRIAFNRLRIVSEKIRDLATDGR